MCEAKNSHQLRGMNGIRILEVARFQLEQKHKQMIRKRLSIVWTPPGEWVQLLFQHIHLKFVWMPRLCHTCTKSLWKGLLLVQWDFLESVEQAPKILNSLSEESGGGISICCGKRLLLGDNSHACPGLCMAWTSMPVPREGAPGLSHHLVRCGAKGEGGGVGPESCQCEVSLQLYWGYRKYCQWQAMGSIGHSGTSTARVSFVVVWVNLGDIQTEPWR